MTYESLITGGIWAILAGMLVLTIIVSVGIWIYLSFAFMAIGKKIKYKNYGLAWIPAFGPLIIAFKASKMPWWPWLLLIGYFIPYVSGLFGLAFTVFAVIWQWKMFEEIKRPGWWAILCLIPVLNLVLYGIAAWSKK